MSWLLFRLVLFETGHIDARFKHEFWIWINTSSFRGNSTVEISNV